MLELGDIQGNTLVPLGGTVQHFRYLRFSGAASARAWLARVLPHLTSCADLLGSRSTSVRGCVGWSASGLSQVQRDSDGFGDDEFLQGLAARSRFLGDPVDPRTAGAPETWAVGGVDNPVDAVLILAGDDDRSLDRVIADTAGMPGVTTCAEDRCAKLPGGKEHFGYRDPISQPAVRGFVAPGGELLHPPHDPAAPGEARPGQRRLWPGEFVFGYPTQDPVSLDSPGPSNDHGPTWRRNGSLMVIRRLSQDAALYGTFVRDSVARLRRRPGLEHVTDEHLSALLVGRWRDGTPVALSPRSPDPAIAGDPDRVNNFAFAGPAGGGQCPVGAHIRKAYPRDDPNEIETRATVETHRILRRGMTYGAAPGATPGMAFVAIQTSLERQFEFIQRAWLNNAYQMADGDGHDIIAGRQQRTTGTGRKFVLRYTADGEQRTETLSVPDHFTTPDGGGYFFLPALSVLRRWAAA